ncbi:alpha/beta fold hydrolase [Deinococcus malanensis]|uniref:alpha/beta fold hydrolase n=1 Tax=Deinococcus malanensis TaxID=1706855 RepID=UPI0036295741
MHFNVVRRGQGKPLLLIHGLGSSWRSWEPVLDVLSAQREVIALDLPGFGHTPPLPGKATFQRLADAVTDFLHQENLIGVDAVGSSMGARLVLELARRGCWERSFRWIRVVSGEVGRRCSSIKA